MIERGLNFYYFALRWCQVLINVSEAVNVMYHRRNIKKNEKRNNFNNCRLE